VGGDRLDLRAAGPDKVARFQTLCGRGSQTIQASWALLQRKGEKMPQPKASI